MTKPDKPVEVGIVEEFHPTQKQEALLEVLLDPKTRLLSITKICELADCSREFYYTTMRNTAFVDYYKQLAEHFLKSKMGALIQYGLQEAFAGTPQSPAYWKVLMEMAGAWSPKGKGELLLSGDDPNGSEITIRFVDPDYGDD